MLLKFILGIDILIFLMAGEFSSHYELKLLLAESVIYFVYCNTQFQWLNIYKKIILNELTDIEYSSRFFVKNNLEEFRRI